MRSSPPFSHFVLQRERALLQLVVQCARLPVRTLGSSLFSLTLILQVFVDVTIPYCGSTVDQMSTNIDVNWDYLVCSPRN